MAESWPNAGPWDCKPLAVSSQPSPNFGQFPFSRRSRRGSLFRRIGNTYVQKVGCVFSVYCLLADAAEANCRAQEV